jgi:hypothetical protein
MRGREIGFLLVFGCLFWLAGTLWYEKRGPLVFETTAARYWVNFVLTPILTTVVCLLVLRWQKIAAAQWASATLLIALPGMLGEAVLLANFRTLMPGMGEASAGRYGALLFATYALVLGIAETVSLRAVR